MILDVEKARLNNRMLVSKNRNCNEMTAANTSKRVPHQYSVSTVIEG